MNRRNETYDVVLVLLKEPPNCTHCNCPETIDHFIFNCPKYSNESTNLINSLITKPNIYSKITVSVHDFLFGNSDLSYEENCDLQNQVIVFIEQTNRLT